MRIYKLHAGNEQHFHERFSEQCIRLCGVMASTSCSRESGEAGTRSLSICCAGRIASRRTRRGEVLGGPDWVEIKKVTRRDGVPCGRGSGPLAGSVALYA